MQIVKRIIKVVGVLAIIAAIGVGGYYAYDRFVVQKNAVARAGAFTGAMTQIERAAKDEIKEIVSASGTVYLKDEQSIYATGDAKVDKVFVEVGDEVKEGQELVIYDVEKTKEDLERKIKEAEINLGNQQLTLQSMLSPISQSEIDKLQNSVYSSEKQVFDATQTLKNTEIKIEEQEKEIERLEGEIAKAEETLQINQQLFDAGAITEDELKKYKDAIVTATENRDKAIVTLNDYQRTIESNEKNIESAQVGLELSKKQLENADKVLDTEADQINYQKQQNSIKLSELTLSDYRKQLEDITYNTTSPLNGIITTVNVEKGSAVTNASVLVKAADFQQLIVKANVSEYDAPSVELGQTVTMTSDGIPDTVYEGKIIKISNTATTQSAVSGSETVVPIEISVDNVDVNIKPGFSLDLEILTVHKKDVIGVPLTAVLKDKETGKSNVFVVDEDRNLRKTEVTLGIKSDMNVEIVTGLKEGDSYVVTAESDMTDGLNLRDYMMNKGGGPGGTSGANGFNPNRNTMQGIPTGNAGGGGVRVNRVPGQ